MPGNMENAYAYAVERAFVAEYGGIPSGSIMWEYGADIVLDAFFKHDSEACMNWQRNFIKKYAAEILAAHPEIANDENYPLFQED